MRVRKFSSSHAFAIFNNGWGFTPQVAECSRAYSSAHGPLDVRILEVAARDGLQNVKQIVPTATKVELIHGLADAGLRHIEATSFVSAKWAPQLADNAKVMEQVLSLMSKGIRLPVLAPNLRGLENAAKSGAQEVVVFASAAEAFSKANMNCSVEEALIAAEKAASNARRDGMCVRGVISCVFADPYSGPADSNNVVRITKRFLEMGCYEVGLGDTLGVGTPYQTQKLLERLLQEVPARESLDTFTTHTVREWRMSWPHIRWAYAPSTRQLQDLEAVHMQKEQRATWLRRRLCVLSKTRESQQALASAGSVQWETGFPSKLECQTEAEWVRL